MASQNHLFDENLGHEEPVDIDGDQQDAEDDDGNVVEGVLVGTRRPNDFDRKIALCGLRWFKLNVSKCQKMSSCQKDVKCQIVKHLDYGGGTQKK